MRYYISFQDHAVELARVGESNQMANALKIAVTVYQRMDRMPGFVNVEQPVIAVYDRTPGGMLAPAAEQVFWIGYSPEAAL